MSNRSIIELNHDNVHEIKAAREEFVRLIIQALNSGSKREWEELERFGVRHATTAHHSDERKVVTRYGEYPL
jgi:hypothetical protein